MWKKSEDQKALCAKYREALEGLRAGVGRAEAAVELQGGLPAEVIAHAQICKSCVETSEIFWESRKLLAGSSAIASAGVASNTESMPWFATRVMARIAERETENRVANAEWSGAVTRLASRLAWVSALALVVAGTLVYEPQPRTGSSRTVSQAPAEAAQYLFDSAAAAANVDDALAGPVER